MKLFLRQNLNKKNWFTEIISLSNNLNITEFYSVTIEKINCKLLVADYHIKNLNIQLSYSGTNTYYSATMKNTTSEKLKKRCNVCSQTFAKFKHTEIKKVEHTEHGCVTHVALQKLTEQGVIKEN